MSVHSRRSASILETLRVLAGGRGWLVEEAFRHSPPTTPGGPVQLRDVALYIIDHRLAEDELAEREREALTACRDEWLEGDGAAGR